MSFTNYEWYGWVCLFFAIATTLRLASVTAVAAIGKSSTLDGKKEYELHFGAPALAITLAVWMACP